MKIVGILHKNIKEKLFKQYFSFINMSEKEIIFSSKVKYVGIFNFSEFYNFCYNWLVDEVELELGENKYEEKISGDSKNIKVEWEGKRKLTDYFRFVAKVNFKIINLKKAEITNN